MKKYCFLAAALLLAGSITGCAGSPSRQTLDHLSKSPVLSVPSHTEPVSGKVPSEAKSLTFQQMGKVQNVFPMDGKTVLVVGSKLYLYQPGDGKVIAEAKAEYSVQSCTTYQDGFLLVGIKLSTGNSGDIQYFFDLYDWNLKKTAAIPLDHVSTVEWLGDPQVSISPDGEKIGYATLSGLYLYDIASKQETKLLELTGPTQKNAGITAITQPYFTNNGQSIGFLAQSLAVPLVQGQQSYATCGLIDVDGGELINQKPSDFSIYERIGAYHSYALFSQDFRKPNGQILKMEIPSGKLSYLKTSVPKESECVFGSDKGAYYVSTYLSGTSWVVRVYDTATGRQLTEKTIACADKVYSYQAPTIRVLDETKTCIVLMGERQSDCETSTNVFQF